MKSTYLKRPLAAALILTCGGAAMAIDADPFLTGRAGEYLLTRPADVLRGLGGGYPSVRIWAPWLIQENDGGGMDNTRQNSAVAETDAQGLPYGALTTFDSSLNPNTLRTITAFGTTDAANMGGMGSNNVFHDEGASSRSNSFGVLLEDGTAVWRANFNTGQNNLEWRALPWPGQTGALSGSGNPVFLTSAPGINGNSGAVFLGTPGALKTTPAARGAAGVGQFLIGVTTFDALTGDAPRGTSVYDITGGPVNPNANVTEWPQDSSPVPTGEDIAAVRQTQPAMEEVTVDCDAGSSTDAYVAFGVGFSSTNSVIGLSGGASKFQTIIVDRNDGGAASGNAGNDGYANGFAFIDADGDFDTSTANNDLRFVDHNATGGGGEPFLGGLFDINSSGQVVVVHENRSVSPRVYEVRRYDPIVSDINGECVITGYNPHVVIARSGQDGFVAALQSAGEDQFNQGQIFVDILVPFSGVGIDDEGRVAFVGVVELFEDPNADITNAQGTVIGQGPRIQSTTNAMCVYDPDLDTLFAVAYGGQNGDILPSIDGGVTLQPGFFSIDQASDTFIREGLSETGGSLALAFRDGVPDTASSGAGDLDGDGFDDDGGVLDPGGNELPVRGILSISLGDRCDCPGDVNGDCMVNFSDLNVVLAGFGSTFDFSDLNTLLARFGTNCVDAN